jgi:hypothetical protein
MSNAELAAIGREAARLDALLKPIANGPVDFTDPNWALGFARNPPLDRAGVRREAEALLDAMLLEYEQGGDADRIAIRDLFQRHRAFCWATPPPAPRDSAAGFRRHLIHLSARDQATDARDELLALGSLCADAARAGVAIAPILREIAAISSDQNRYGMGSTRKFLHDAATRR